MNLSKDRLNSALAILALFASITIALTVATLRQVSTPTISDYVINVASLWGAPMIDVTRQTSGYKAFLFGLLITSVACALASLTKPFVLKGDGFGFSRFLLKLSALPRILPWLTPLLWLPLVYLPRPTTFGTPDGLIPFVPIILASTSIITAVLSQVPSRLLQPTMIGLIMLYSAVLALPGLLSPISLDTSQLRGIDWHYESVMGVGEQFGKGLDVFREIRPPYGILGPAIVGILHRVFGPMDFLTHIRLVQGAQFIFFLLALGSYKLWLRKQMGLWFIGALLIGPWVSLDHLAVLYPNQSGWRFWCLAFGIGVLLLAKGRPIRVQALLLGSTIGLAILAAPELSIVLGISYIAYFATLIRTAQISHAGRTIAMLGASVFAVIAIYYLVHFIFFGGVPLNFGRIFATVRYVAQSGFSGALIYYDPTALCVMGLASYRCALITLRYFQNGLRRNDGVQLAISVITLIWLNYFVNRADPWNLWTQIYLLPFLLPRGLWALPAPRLGRPTSGLGLTTSGINLRLGRQVFILSFLVAPIIISSNKPLISNAIAKWEQAKHAHSQNLSIQGWVIPHELSAHLQAKCNYLTKRTDGKVFCLTKFPYTTRLQIEAEPRIWISNPFISWPESGLRTFCQYVEDSEYDTMLIDGGSEPQGILDSALAKNWSSLVRKFQSKLKDHFELIKVEEGWEVWKRKPTLKSGQPTEG